MSLTQLNGNCWKLYPVSVGNQVLRSLVLYKEDSKSPDLLCHAGEEWRLPKCSQHRGPWYSDQTSGLYRADPVYSCDINSPISHFHSLSFTPYLMINLIFTLLTGQFLLTLIHFSSVSYLCPQLEHWFYLHIWLCIEFLHSLAPSPQTKMNFKQARHCTFKSNDAFQEFIILKGFLN